MKEKFYIPRKKAPEIPYNSGSPVLRRPSFDGHEHLFIFS